ncbi:MAG: hypothetical protein IPI03_03290 [Rubrivivax sp.]|nr:hypothetical protein [Rubrivivax sp.]
MRLLAGLESDTDGLTDVDRLMLEYQAWIVALDSKVSTIAERHRPTATELIEKCRQCARRIADGLLLLRQTDSQGEVARKAFRLANHAMLVAQLRSRQELRLPDRDPGGRR